MITSIPNKYFGYGVGGALAAKGHAELVNEEEIWEGKLREGAMLQYWNDFNSVGLEILKAAIKDEINDVENTNFNGGHSVIFKSYIRDSDGNITGFRFYDYSVTHKTASLGSSQLFLGANLKDIN